MLLPQSLSRSDCVGAVSGIYAVTHIESGKVYVGQSMNIGRRLRDHRRAPNESLISRCVRKYGAEAFEVRVVELCEEGELDAREIHWIEALDSIHPAGLNIRSGGGRDTICAKEMGAVISQKLRGRTFTDEHKANLSRAHIGIGHSAEARKKMSASHTGAKRSAEARAAMAAAQKIRYARRRAEQETTLGGLNASA
jgi:group I intron endonuclease